jgi:hypothetical protein
MAGLAVTEMLNRLFRLGGSTATELLFRLDERKISRNRRPSRPGCFCQTTSAWGLGTHDPYLDLTWPD